MIDTSQQRADHILIISHDVIGTHMAGPGIRYWEMARVLAAYHPVTLIAPRPIDQPATAFTCGSYNWGNPASLVQWLNNADIVVANGMLLQGHPELAQTQQPLVLDLYDPVMLENLELFRDASADQRITRTQQDAALLQQQLAAGDFFLCATERQRDLYIGALMVSGRITPDLVDDNAQLRNLIDVVSFGLPAEPPIKQRSVLRGVIPGIGVDDSILLWTGGLWDWMDPLTLVRAMPQVVARYPHVRLIFLAGQHPGNTHPMRVPQDARELAQALGLLDRHIFFYEHWVPYAQRADFLLEADIAISLHRDHLETAYAAIRSRFFDHLWAELPSVVSAGDAAAELVQQHNLGRVVPVENTSAVALALNTLLEDSNIYQQCRNHIQQFKPGMSWHSVITPLLTWLKATLVIARERPAGMLSVINPEIPMEHTNTQTAQEQFERLTALVRQAEQLWSLQSTPPVSSNSFVQLLQTLRLYLQQTSAPLYEQQTQFNATIIHLLYWMSDEIQRKQHLEYCIQELVPQVEALTTAHHQTQMMVEELAGVYHQTHTMLHDLLADYQATRAAIERSGLLQVKTE